MSTPEKDYYYLEELGERGISLADIKYWLTKGCTSSEYFGHSA